MTDPTTPRFALPLLVPGQAGKDITHNEALALLDAAIQPSVIAIGVNDPPPTASLGQAWIVGRAPTGPWAGHAQALASWTGGGWRFLLPTEGFAVWSISELKPVTYRDGMWQESDVVGARVIIGGQTVVGAQAAAIADPVGGGATDESARSVLIAILGALRQHGLIAR